MSWYNNMRTRLQAQGTSIAGSQSMASKQAFINNFKDSPSYRTVLISGVETPVRLNQGKQYGYKVTNPSEFKIMLLLPETKVDIGSIITIDSVDWIALDFFDDDIYPRCDIHISNHLLKWQNEFYEIKTSPSVITQSFSYIDEDKFMFLPAGIYSIIIPFNKDTVSIKTNDRFLFNDKAYKITHIDKMTTIGLIRMTATEDIIIEEDMNGIANYKDGFYTIIINNGLDLKINLNEQIHLDVVVKYGGIILDAPIIYENLNDEVISVNENGVITPLNDGTSIVNIKVLGLTRSVAIRVIDDSYIPDSLYIAIDGEPEINKGKNYTYIAKLYNNGVLVDNFICSWDLNSTKAVIVSQDNNSCTIMGNTEELVRLTCTLEDNSMVRRTLSIKIKGLW